jgi:hypothetical protein
MNPMYEFLFIGFFVVGFIGLTIITGLILSLKYLTRRDKWED